ncbi:MAG: D-alanyl-D-alanine carboxypeptidase family protein [Ruminococcaceae bacterium]|nr:D-alanyl-D-alanine carboxypeptidase family protein [Oscillospiraceae bacterium]
MNSNNKPRYLFLTLLAACVVLFAVMLWEMFYTAPAGGDNTETVTGQESQGAQTQTQTLTEEQTTAEAVTSPETLPPETTQQAPTLDAYEASLGYDVELRERYESYQQNNPELDAQTVVKNVNIGIDREFYSVITPIDDPASFQVQVNKYRSLPADYVPSDLVALEHCYPDRKGSVKLRADAAAAFERMAEDALKLGYVIRGYSGYRSYSYQDMLYTNYCKNDPVYLVDTYSARPGHSEHQTGLAIDVCTDKYAYNKFGQSQEYLWAKENIHKYGFVISYLEDKNHITGYKTEEWHFRYVGEELAAFLYENNLVLDEYFAMYGDKA